MRMILIAASAVMLASCTTPEMRAANVNNGPQQADANISRDEAPPPPQLSRPPRRGWAGYGYRSTPR